MSVTGALKRASTIPDTGLSGTTRTESFVLYGHGKTLIQVDRFLVVFGATERSAQCIIVI